MRTSPQTLGRWGETYAAEYLRQRGYVILDHNVRSVHGELDLIARQTCANSLVTVFVEVKTRRSTAFGLPEASITPRKKTHLLAAAQAYLQAHPELDGDWRIDVIAILRRYNPQETEIAHFENAIS